MQSNEKHSPSLHDQEHQILLIIIRDSVTKGIKPKVFDKSGKNNFIKVCSINFEPILTFVTSAMFIRFLVEHGLFQYYSY